MAPVMSSETVAVTVRSPSARSPRGVHQAQNRVLVLAVDHFGEQPALFGDLRLTARFVEVDAGHRRKHGERQQNQRGQRRNVDCTLGGAICW